MSRPVPLIFSTIATLLLAACQSGTDRSTGIPHADRDLVARGEYLVRIGGCNDCHTPAYAERQGQVDTSEWLVGSPMGYHGPWGTTYATNLRLSVNEKTETQWMQYSGSLHTRPIMPDFTVRAMSEDDRRAIYRFIQSLGSAGKPAPDSLPPGQTPLPPYFALVLPPSPPAPPAPAAPNPD